MFKFIPILVLSVPFFFNVSCRSSYKINAVEYKDYRVTESQSKDEALSVLLKPYRDSVNKSMNDIVGTAALTLEKKSPEGTLGNFMADAFYTMAAEKYKTRIDLAIMNYGGVRLTQLPAGVVTRGKIFELMPFDNMLIIQRMKGSVLQELLDLIAARGGWPVAGMTMQIKDKKAVNVMVRGEALDPGRIYTVANSDFIANGGDNAEMLKSIPQESIGYLMRDALFDYIQKHDKKIGARLENRVSYVQ